MSKSSKARAHTDVCADCGAAEPTWASINRGILLCVQCCHTHRSLGRHISIVKSLKSTWPATLLAMVHALNNGGANSIWEYALDKDSKLAKRKPQSTDNVEEKGKFIKAKHLHNEFLQRPERNDTLCMENELGKQLHASVRSNNVVTSLRLMIQGADPNYFHDEKGTTPLHAAVKANQMGQIELLIVYGADPTYPDASGNTAVDYAKKSINTNVLNRLVEAQYEITDKFAQFLCMKKPDHHIGIHLLVPKLPGHPNASAGDKLRKLANNVFEELVKDVYDEVDRREIEASWVGNSDTINLPTVPFLPVDATLSSTRNQSRQKLARFAIPELKALVRDILEDVQRRQHCLNNKHLSLLTDDDPLYDSVASDDDYAQVPSEDGEVDGKKSEKSRENGKYEDLVEKLRLSTNTITDLSCEVKNLKVLVEHLTSVNHELRSRLSQVDLHNINGNVTNIVSRLAPKLSAITSDSGSHSLDSCLLNRVEETHSMSSLSNGYIANNNNNNNEPDCRIKRVQRPSSMYETREGLRTPNWQTIKHQLKQNELTTKTKPLHCQNIMQCTEQVTRGISDLWKSIQGNGRDNCIQYADQIRFAVTNLTKAIPGETSNDIVRQLLESVAQLQTNCIGLQNSKHGDGKVAEKYQTSVRTYAYEIARATKELVTKYNSH